METLIPSTSISVVSTRQPIIAISSVKLTTLITLLVDAFILVVSLSDVSVLGLGASLAQKTGTCSAIYMSESVWNTFSANKIE